MTLTSRVSGMLFVIGVVLALPCFAQSVGDVPPNVEAAPATDVNYFDFFVVKGGPIAFGLIILSVVTIALTIEHSVSIRRATIVPSAEVEQTKELIQKRQYREAIQLASGNPSMLSRVVHAALSEASNGFEAMERAMAESLEERSARLFRKTEFIHIIGNVSPMIGLLGTVTGMILLFAEIHAADAFPGARVVADRIAIALITTFWGLAVAIPALSIFALFRNRIDVLTAECALAAEDVLGVLKPGATPATPPTAGTSAPAPSKESHAPIL